MLEWTRVAVFDQVVEQTHVAVVHLLFDLAERDARRVDDRRLGAEAVDQPDPPLSVKYLYMLRRWYVQVFHNSLPSFKKCSVVTKIPFPG